MFIKLIIGVLLFSSSMFLSQENSKKMKIFVNQLGYFPNQLKTAITILDSDSFQIYSLDSNKIVYTGKSKPSVYWKLSEENVKALDFTNFTEQGKYKIIIGKEESYPFIISKKIYSSISIASLKAFYYMRASTEIFSKYAGKWSRKGGHPDNIVYIHKSAADSLRPEGTIISCPGGWYDAGDYNKYVVNSGITTYTLLALYETFPEAIENINMNIPESGNDIPDILDEVLWNLRWLLTMQDPNDGGVYHKLTSKEFSEFKMPSELNDKRYVVQKSTGAALDFAALFATASRIFRKFQIELPGFADTCLQVAKYAYQWAEKHPHVFYKNPKDINTGTYNTRGLEDEMIWATVELLIATRDEKYYDKNIYQYEAAVPSWSWVPTLAYISILNNQDKVKGIINIKRIKDKLSDISNILTEIYSKTGYGITNDYFYWGSNGELLNQSMMLLLGYHLLNEKKYLDAVVSNMDYILGKNPLAKSYVTGFGTDSPMNPHFRLSASDKIREPIPGFVVGGPHPFDVSDCGKEQYPTLIPAKCYLDKICSYSTNEVAINWNAPLAFVLFALNYLLFN